MLDVMHPVDIARSDIIPEDSIHTSINVLIAFLVLSWTFVSLRLWVRIRMINNFGWDDATMIATLLLFTGYCISLLYIETHARGMRVEDFPVINDLIKWSIPAEALYLFTMVMLKISLGILFKRIVITRSQEWVIYVTVAISTLVGTANTIFVIVRCGNPERYLIHNLTNKCVSMEVTRALQYLHSAINALTDFVFATLPISVLWAANMEKRTKFSVGLVLLLGIAGSICSCIRIVYIEGLLVVEDFFASAATASMWSAIESGTGVVAGCLATMRPLFIRCFQQARNVSNYAARSLSNKSKRLSRSWLSDPTSIDGLGHHMIRNSAFIKECIGEDETGADRISATYVENGRGRDKDLESGIFAMTQATPSLPAKRGSRTLSPSLPSNGGISIRNTRSVNDTRHTVDGWVPMSPNQFEPSPRSSSMQTDRNSLTGFNDGASDMPLSPTRTFS